MKISVLILLIGSVIVAIFAYLWFSTQDPSYEPIVTLLVSVIAVIGYVFSSKGEKNPNIKIKISKPQKKDRSHAEIEYFLHKEIRMQGTLLNYKYLVDLWKERIEKTGVVLYGPTCSKRGEYFVVSYNAKGTSKDGRVWDHFADFKVDSASDTIIAESELAKTIMSIIRP